MAIEQPQDAIRSLATGTVSAQAFSSDGQTLYTVRGGSVSAYDSATGMLKSSWVLGTKLGGIDVSADGRYMVVTELGAETQGSTFPIHRIDLTTGVSTTYNVPHMSLFNFSTGFGDVAILSDGRAMLAGTDQWEPLTFYDFASGSVTHTAQAYFPGSFSESADHSTILVSSVGISSAPLYLFNGSGDQTAVHDGYRDDIIGYNAGVQAISSDGSLIVQGVSLAVYDNNLNLITKLSERYPFTVSGLAFSPDGTTLYVLDQASDQVFALSTKNWDVVGGFNVDADVSASYSGVQASRTADALHVSADGKYLTVTAETSVQLIDLTKIISETGTSAGNDVVTGDSDDNYLYGFEGDDTLDGRGGGDELFGGSGNDTYYVDQPGDYVHETANGGVDTVRATYGGYRLPSYVERLVLGDGATFGYGNDAANSLVANDAGNMLYGMDGDDVLTGGRGNDELDGGLGNDRMEGGAGDDRYIIDSPADVVIERGGEGNDTVIASVTMTLAAEVENLILQPGTRTLNGSGNAMDNVLTGNSGDNQLYGLAGDDRLLGGLGIDRLSGGDGADTFLGTRAELAGDTITDLSVGDRIVVSDLAYADASVTRIGAALSLGEGASVTIANAANTRLVVNAAGEDGTEIAAVNRYTGLSDFNGDGHSDLLWREAGGDFSTWGVSGNADGNQLAKNSTYVESVGANWTIAETFDFNGDGRSDILWREQDAGQFTIWNGQGSSWAQNSYSDNTVASDWKIAGVGDLNGDGRDDIVWRQDSGAFSTWQSTGTGFNTNVTYDSSVAPDWKIVGLADFDGDNKDDLLWRNQGSGAFSIWRSTGNGFTPNTYYDAGVDTSWHIDGLADFNGDGKDDILWRHDGDGVLTTWQSTGSGFDLNVYDDHSVSPMWQVANTGDFNGDGKADLMFRNVADGTFTTWESNGDGFDPNVVSDSSVGTNWQVQAHDFQFG
jgi:Ca2+-binding RTX toxin-like protein